MNTYPIENIEDLSTFTQDVYLDKKFILLPNNIPFDEKLKEKLLECSFTNVYSEGIAELADNAAKEKSTEGETNAEQEGAEDSTALEDEDEEEEAPPQKKKKEGKKDLKLKTIM